MILSFFSLFDILMIFSNPFSYAMNVSFFLFGCMISILEYDSGVEELEQEK